MIWITADTHFGHTRILDYCNRPFASIEEMNDVLIANINACWHPGDRLIHLGDFAVGKNPLQYADRIKFRVIELVPGNHDIRKLYIYRDSDKFNILSNCYYSKNNSLKKSFIFSHYAMRVWHKSHYGSFHLYGHSHGRLPGLGRSMDVGVDAVGYKSISLRECYERLKNKRHESPASNLDIEANREH